MMKRFYTTTLLCIILFCTYFGAAAQDFALSDLSSCAPALQNNAGTTFKPNMSRQGGKGILNTGDQELVEIVKGASYKFSTLGTSFDAKMSAENNSFQTITDFRSTDDIRHRIGEGFNPTRYYTNETINWIASFTGNLSINVRNLSCAYVSTSAAFFYQQFDNVIAEAPEDVYTVCGSGGSATFTAPAFITTGLPAPNDKSSNADFEYQWQTYNTTSNQWENIQDATGRTFTKSGVQDFELNSQANPNTGLYRYTVKLGALTKTSAGHAKLLPQPFNEPVGFTASDDRCDGTIKMDWEWYSQSPESWKIEYTQDTTGGGTWQTLRAGIEGTKRSYTQTDVTRGEIYFVRIMAFDDNCGIFGLPSAVEMATSPLDPAGPTNVTTTIVDVDGGKGVQVTWTDNSDNEDGFFVERSLLSGGGIDRYDLESTFEGKTATGRTLSFIDEGVENCIQYKWRVYAYNTCSPAGERVDGESSDETIQVGLETVFDSPDDLVGSKGYFTDRIELKWEVNQNSNINFVDRFRIYARELGETAEPAFVQSVDPETRLYNDERADAGVLYEYFIIAESDCGESTVRSLEPSSIPGFSNVPFDLPTGVGYSIGYRSPSGIVNGNITYQGGIAVPNVKVVIEKESGASGKSLLFDGIDDHVKFDHTPYLAPTGNFTLSTWVKPTNVAGQQVLISKDESYKLEIRNSSAYFAVKDGANVWHEAHADSVDLENGEFVSLLAVKASDSVKLYINGILKAGKAAVFTMNVDNSDLYLGSSGAGANHYAGHIDEVRLHSVALSNDRILRDFSRIIDPGASNLLAYFQLNEGVGPFVFDAAKTGRTFHANDGLISGASWSELIPDGRQLGIAGYTNQSGNYSIPGVVYTGTGNNFSVTPRITLGGAVHEFSPAEKVIFIGEGNSVINQVDFIDVSSFKVTGQVVFDFGDRNSGSPGVNFLIDGTQLVTNNRGEPIATDDFGQFEIQVPIGEHTIVIRKAFHEFQNEGKWPTTQETFDFQEPQSGIQFFDITTRKLVGRVVGGTDEGDKKFGFNKSINNIGTANFWLRSQDELIKVPLQTDPGNGEYSTEVPPLKYTIFTDNTFSQTGINLPANTPASNYFQNPQDPLEDVDLRDVAQPLYEVDTVYSVADPEVIDDIDSIEYNLKQNFIYRAVPQITVTNGDKGKEGKKFDGEDFWIIPSRGEVAPDTIKLKTATGDLVTPYPVFSRAQKYNMVIALEEVYTNNEVIIAGQPMKDTVRVSDAKLDITNRIGKGQYLNPETGGWTNYVDGEPGVNPDTLLLNSPDGDTLYTFVAVDPELQGNVSTGLEATSFTKTLQITARAGGNVVYWPGPSSPDVFRGYVFGAKPIGTSFVTKAPTQVDFILRDPMGGNSFSSMQSGQKISTTTKFSLATETFLNLDLGIGVGVSTFVGLGFGTINEASTEATVGMKFGATVGTGNTKVDTYEVTETFTTSSEPLSVGAPSDVYVAKSENIRYGVTQSLAFVDETECGLDEVGCPLRDTPNAISLESTSGKRYDIGSKFGFFLTPEGDPTFFVFSQGNILKVLIPDLVALRNTVLLNNPNYQTKRDGDDPLFGANNDDPVWGEVGLTPSSSNYPLTDPEKDFDGPSYTFEPDNNDEIDSVRWFNQQIRLWQETIAANEKEKVDAIEGKLGPAENISFSALSEFQRSVTTTHSESKETKFDLAIGMSAGTDVDLNMFGVAMSLEIEGGINVNTSFENEQEQESTTTYEFTLADPDQDDLYSIDVYPSKRGNGPLFIMKGGQTSCPHEDLAQTQFYRPGTKIGERSLQRDKPTLAVDVPVVYNVPDTEAAVYTLTLGNASETQDGQFYAMQPIESSNPNGAILKIDGATFDSRREFFIPGNSVIQKILTVERGPYDFDYEDIQVMLVSTCQFDPTDQDANLADTVSLSAFFLPACTVPEILTPKDQWVVNSSFDDTLDIAIGNFNINRAGFKEIDLQYKPSSSSGWIRVNKFYRDTTGFNDPKAIQIPRNNPTINYEWDVSQLSDGTYDIRALAACDVPVTQTTVFGESEIFSGLIDRVNPVPFGRPQPADGILSPGDEIMIQFNETINAGLLRPANFDIRGVLNGGEIRHDASVHFGGVTNNYVEIAEGINLTNKDFSIEFYVKPTGGTGREVVISQGRDAATGLQIGIDEANRVFLSLAGRVITTQRALVDSKWTHVAVTYNVGQTTAVISLNAEPDVVSNSFDVTYSEIGKILIAKNGYAPEMNFKGNVHELRIWNKALSEAEVARFATARLSRSQADIMGNWRMEEAQGTLTEDIIRSRNALVFGTWQVEPSGRALELDGNDLITAPSTSFGDESNFTIELWFKASQSNTGPVTFFSNGNGQGGDSNTSGWEIGADADGKIMYANNGRIISGTTDGYFDNNWHHVALVLTRFGNTILYVDGEEKKAVETTGFNSFGGSKFWMGARGTFDGAIEVTDQFLIGALDEVRVWGAARRASQIKNDMNSKLSGNEPGLVAYYPFEEFLNDSGVLISVASDKDQAATTKSTIDSFLPVGDPIFSTNTPTIKQPRPVKAVNFTFTANGDRIILSPTDPDSLLENTILDITVSNILDLNGNVLQSPVTWSAFVNRNDLIWESQELGFEVELGNTLTFTTKIINQGGQIRTYNITNMPPWLKVSPTSGVIEPLTSQTITFTLLEGVNIGVYNEDIFVTSDFGFDERLSLDLKIFKAPPQWSLNPADYQFAMSVVGRIEIEGKFSRNEDDMIAAFVGDEIRGVANLQYVEPFDNFQAFLQVYSNVVSDEEITYRIWNASEGKIHTDINPSIGGVRRFSSNATYGSATEPVIFRATNVLRNEFKLVKGWQWISINLNSNAMSDVNEFFKDYNATSGDQIKTQFEFDQYGFNGWNGTISNAGGLRNNALYKLKLANPGELNVEGSVIDPSSYDINVRFGWNWIGFISQRNLNVNEAMANFNPIPGDQIKSQRQFAIYAGQAAGWIGNLTVLQPGQGFMLFSNDQDDKTFNFPVSGILSGRVKVENADVQYLTSGPEKVDVENYANNMSLILTTSSGVEQGDTLLAYVGSELRGIAVPTYNAIVDQHMYFMTIFGNEATDDPIKFTLKSASKRQELLSTTVMAFRNNVTGGTLNEPIVLQQIDNLEDETNEFVLSPNPFTSRLELRFVLDQEEDTQIRLYNMTGQMVSELFNGRLNDGQHRMIWSDDEYGLDQLKKGIYILRFRAGGQYRAIKVIKEN